MKPKIPTIPGTAFAGGFYAGRINIDNIEYALVIAPKAEGESGGIWNGSIKEIKGALNYSDGLANTKAMAKTDSKLAQWAQALKIGGYADWYLPSLDELELCYRYLKPDVEQNYCWARAGINLSAVPPTWPYTPEAPKQTKVKAFRKGGAQAFDLTWYWTSTQHAAHSDRAWMQLFSHGGQDYNLKSGGCRARAVRRIKI